MRRGSNLNPPNRFEATRLDVCLDQLADDDEWLDVQSRRPVEYFDDRSGSIVSENRSPDIPFRYSVNPYRGCLHGCSYCYARNTHEYLGLNAGEDFETRIMVKQNAPELLRQFLRRKAWKGDEWISFSGVTDCYQPVERRMELTRGCLQVCHEHSQSVGIITKNRMVCRDIDLLGPMAARKTARVWLSVTSLDRNLTGVMEPGTTRPEGRLRAIRELSEAGIPCGVMVAPVIPGLNDHEIPSILKAASEAGARHAGYILLRLPMTVRPVFEEWLQKHFPDRVAKVTGRLRQSREGEMNTKEFHKRMKGSGEMADQIAKMFATFRTRYGLDSKPEGADYSQFRSRPDDGRQMQISFDG